MNSLIVNQERFIEWGIASRAPPGEAAPGLHLVTPSPDGMLAAVVDGLGSGGEAAKAAQMAVQTLQAHAGRSVIDLVRHCHRTMQATRGAVMTVVSFNDREGTVTALGIGNVEACLLRANRSAHPARESVRLRGGIIGRQLPALCASILPIQTGDLVILATDGIRDGFADGVDPAEPLPLLAERVLRHYFHAADDALVLAIRYLGMPRA